MFYQKLFQKCCMEIHVHFICTKYIWDLIKTMYIRYLRFHEEHFIKGRKEKEIYKRYPLF